MWISACDNAQALERLYTSLEGLETIDLHEVVLHRDGPRLTLRFDLSRFPDRDLPPRWPRGANTVQVALSFWGAADLRLTGWPPQGRGVLVIQAEGDVTRVAFTAGDTDLRAAFASARVDSVSAYATDAAGS